MNIIVYTASEWKKEKKLQSDTIVVGWRRDDCAETVWEKWNFDTFPPC